MKTEVVTIIGLDRIGGSIGLALRAASLGLSVWGSDKEKANLERALELGAIDKAESNPAVAANMADILILNSPPANHEDTLRRIGKHVKEHTLVVDVSSRKALGLQWANEYLAQGHYVGASPVLAAEALADSRPGIEAAKADLFKRSVFCLMPSANADPQAVETAVNLGRILGATPFFLDALEYDSLMHVVETAPKLVSAAVFRAITQSTGWRDMLRFAGLTFAQSTRALESEDLAELALYNKEITVRWLDVIIEELQQFRRMVFENETERFALVMDDLAETRARWIVDRQKNDWVEVDAVEDLSSISISGQLFGYRPKRKDKK